MTARGFDFLKYGKAIERMMTEWYAYTREVLDQSSDLGFAREHFVKQVLESFLPKSIIVGSGEIVDGAGKRSPQQDVIIYRADFPVITSLTPVNTYLIEGVIATLEVKSDLSTGNPNHLHSAIRNLSRVLSLEKQAYILSGDTDQVEKLQEVSSVKTYIVGYAGWKSQEPLLDHFRIAGNEVKWSVPHLICQPDFCILRNDGYINPNSSEEKGGFLLHHENPYAVLLHHLLKTVLLNTSGSIVTTPGVNAAMNYNLGRYFNFASPLAFTPLHLVAQEKHTS